MILNDVNVAARVPAAVRGYSCTHYDVRVIYRNLMDRAIVRSCLTETMQR